MKITKAVFDLMPKEFQKAFKPVEGNPDQFDNGEEDAAGLKTALEKEKADKVKAAQERDAFKTAADKAEADRLAAEAKKAAENGDFSKIEESYKAQVAEAKKEAAEAKKEAARHLVESHNEAVISQLLPSFTSARAGRAVLATMMKTEIVDGKPVTRFLDAKGNPTALDTEGFQKNLLADPDLKTILVASKGGGGGSTSQTVGGGSTTEKSDFNPSSASGKEMAAHLKAKFADELGGSED